MNQGDMFSPGYISGRTIQDVFTYKFAQLNELLPAGTPNRRQVFQLIDAIRVDLLSRCDVLPTVKERAKPQPRMQEKTDDGDIAPDSRQQYNEYVARNRRQ